MDAYFRFFENHGQLVIRLFFSFIIIIDLIFVYAVIFDRDLPRRIAIKFFGGLSGQTVRIPPTDETIRWWQWLIFIFVSGIPPILWIFLELRAAAGAG